MGSEPEQDPDIPSHLRERVLWAFNKSGYWGYTSHIPDRRSGVGILETFRGEHCPRKNVNVVLAADVVTTAGLKLYECLRVGRVFVVLWHRFGDLHSERKWTQKSWKSMGQARTLKRVSPKAIKTMRFLSFAPPQKKDQWNVKWRAWPWIVKNHRFWTSLRRMILEDSIPLHVLNTKKIKRKRGGVVVSEPERKEQCF